jgi:UDP-glucose 4-epimerase
MKVLITGGYGYLGKNFIKKFHKIHEIIIFCRTLPDKDFLKSYNIIVEKGSIEDIDIVNVIKKHKPDIILHFAALTGLKICEDNPSKAFLINTIGTFNVAKACLSVNSKIIFLSSREVYGETIEKKSNENDSLNPINVYGISKMLAENIIKNLGMTQKLNFMILRLTNVYGTLNENQGVNKIINSALQTNTIQINGGNQTLNLIYVDDTVEIINKIMNNQNQSNEIINLGSNDTLTIDEFSKMISNILENKIELKHHPKRNYEVDYFKPDLKKLKNLVTEIKYITIEKCLEKIIKNHITK